MRAIVAHPPHQNILELRRILLGAGFECTKDDCVEWPQLERRLSGGVVDLLVIQVNDLTPRWLDPLCDAAQLTSAPKLLVGDRENLSTAQLVQRIDATDYLDQQALPRSLEQALERVQESGLAAAQRGSVYAVCSATPGTGVTTIAANLADSLAHTSDPNVAVMELTSGLGRLALQLDVKLPHAAESACERWQSLDQSSFKNCLAKHESGLHIFANAPDSAGNPALCPDAVRRLLSLTRASHSSTVLALSSQCSELTREIVQRSDRVLLLTRPDVPGIRRLVWAYGMLRDTGIDEENVDIVVNRWGVPGQLSKDEIAATLGLTPAEFIPDEPGLVTKAANKGSTLRGVGRGKMVRRLDALANSLRNRHALAI